MKLEWSRAARERTVLSILMIDIDDFKSYNDTYGHVAGDEALKAVAGAARGALKRSADLAARFGGEEFIVVLPATPVSGAESIGEQVRDAVRALSIAHTASSVNAQVSVSIGGAAMIPHHQVPLSFLIEAADGALYEAKRTGKDRVVTREASTTPGEETP